MPFVKKTDSQGTHPLTNAGKIFIGRAGELLFFVQNILKSEYPTHNIISISGQGGVGKSTLLTRFIDEARASNFKDYCLTAFVDEHQVTPASIMEKFAEQLAVTGEFEKALKQYKEALRKLQIQHESLRDTFLRKTVTDVAGSIVKSVPVVGSVLEKEAGSVIEYVLGELDYRRLMKDVEQLEDPLGYLTKAFVEELNQLTNTLVPVNSSRAKRLQRVLLFFDTFEQLAAEVSPWLLNYFLQVDINPNVVLVVAGRDAIERSTSDDLKYWLPYYDNHTIYSISLNSFSQDETRQYLSEREITEQNYIDMLWQLSRGLPLYLSLLTSNRHGEIDPTTNVVANFLRWIPEQEPIKRRLVLDAALLSGPFNQDDLMAFTYFSDQERSALYRWLIGQPFVRSSPQGGKYIYHELAQEMFSRHMYQRSPNEYYTTRRALAKYYQLLLEKTLEEMGKEVYKTGEWLELTLALTRQLMLLTDEASHIRAIELILNAYDHTEQTGEIVRVLRDLSQKQPIANLLLQYIETDLVDQKQKALEVAQDLLEKLIDKPSFSPESLANIYCKRGLAYFSLREYQKAIEDFDSTLKLNSKFAWAYCFRGLTYRNLQEFQRAISDFDRALALEPKLGLVYSNWGLSYFSLREYQKAIEDFDHQAKLDPNSAWVYLQRGIAYRNLKEYQRAIEDFDRALSLNPNYAGAYGERGIVYRDLQKYEQALSDLNRALALNTEDAWAYASRGETYRLCKEYQRAIEDFDKALILDYKYAWAYAKRGQAYSALNEYEQTFEDFDRAIALDPGFDLAYANRGHTCYLRKDYLQAIQDFDYALKLNSKYIWIYAERGWAHLWLKNVRQAREDFIQSWQSDPTNVTNGWIIEWIDMGLEKVNSGIAERLEILAAVNPQHHASRTCQSVALWLRNNFDQALALLEQDIPLDTEVWNTHFWKGMVYATLGRDEEAIAAVDKALVEELPPILLTPLHWFEQDRPEFYEKYVVPFLARYE